MTIDEGMKAGEEAMSRAAAAIDGVRTRFADTQPAVELLLNATGRVVVTGLGKSGLVGAKLAATLASTGTAASFVHAADALHGDAGMVRDGDVLIAISNSGETSEVTTFARLVKQRGVPVVAMTGCNGGSALCDVADVRLDISVDQEADPYDLVPSASTVATAALGDALAIAVMVARGFGPDDFHRHHPAGALGQRLLNEGDQPRG